jgi:hypothetical protein
MKAAFDEKVFFKVIINFLVLFFSLPAIDGKPDNSVPVAEEEEIKKEECFFS